jgi:hypothetical protein
MTKYTNNVGGPGDTEVKVTVSIDYLPMLAEYEIMGVRSKANSYEQNKQAQYQYYAEGNVKDKWYYPNLGHDNDNTYHWYLRSPIANGYNLWCAMNRSSVASQSMTSARGLAAVFKV